MSIVGGDNTIVDGGDDLRTMSRGQLMCLAVFVAICRYAFSYDRKMFVVIPDEPASLAMARFLAGGTRWDMFLNSTWRPGLATLIAPLFWVTDSQENIIHLALMVGAVAGGAAAWVMARLTMRLTNWPARTAIIATGVIAVLPTSLVASAHVWAEPLVVLTFLLTVSHLIEFHDGGRLRFGLMAVTWAVVGYTCHSRLLVLVLVTTVLVAVRLIASRRWRDTLLVVVAAGSLSAASIAYASWLYRTLWLDPGETNTVGEIAPRLGNPLALADAALGQGWYLLAGTAGLFGIGAILLVLRVLGRVPAPGLPRRTDAFVLLATTVPLLTLSVVFMSDRNDRPDMIVYGRYNDAVIWPVIIIAVSWLRSRGQPIEPDEGSTTRWILPTVGALWVGSGVGTWALHRDDLIGLSTAREAIAGVIALNGSQVEIRVLSLTVATLALAVGLFLLDRWNRRFTALASIGVAAGLGLATRSVLDPGDSSLYAAAAIREVNDAGMLPPGSPIVFAYDDHPEARPPYTLQRYYAHTYQWFLPEHEFTITFDDRVESGTYVIAPANSRALVTSGATPIWVDPVVELTLWRVGAMDVESP